MASWFEAPLWKMRIYASLREEVDPSTDRHYFRQRSVGYTGDLSFWKTPSPEPELPPLLIERLSMPLAPDDSICLAASTLAARIKSHFDPEQTLFVAILRAGVPLAAWLRRMLPGSEAVATSLFVGLGIDQAALSAIRADYPDRRIVFVDGWTGKGGVANELRRLEAGPLAVLSDPWGQAELRGTRNDVFSPSACFTGPTTLGFSRTFHVHDDERFAAYRFPDEFLQARFVESWLASCPVTRKDTLQDISEFRIKHESPLRLHSNEVCRALINSNPETLLFSESDSIVRSKFEFLLALAEAQKVPQRFNVSELDELNAQVACTLRLSC